MGELHLRFVCLDEMNATEVECRRPAALFYLFVGKDSTWHRRYAIEGHLDHWLDLADIQFIPLAHLILFVRPTRIRGCNAVKKAKFGFFNYS